MEETYFTQRDETNILKIREIRKGLPAFCGDFFRGVEPYTTPLTRLGYARDIKLFFDFLVKETEEFCDKPILQIDIDDLNKITATHIEMFLEYISLYKIDGKTYSGQYSFMLISNANRIAGINNFYKDVKLDDSEFEVILCNLTKRSEIVKSFYFLATSNLTQAKGFEFHKLSELEITFNEVPKNAWCVDGEKLISNEKTYKIEIEKNFNILMPKKNIKKLFINK